MAGAAGLEPVTSAVTGQRSNQLSYAPAWGRRTYGNACLASSGREKNIRAADAKEVGVGNPAEETYCHPNNEILCPLPFLSIPGQLMLIILMHSLHLSSSSSKLEKTRRRTSTRTRTTLFCHCQAVRARLRFVHSSPSRLALCHG
jgi:hypothetical protein